MFMTDPPKKIKAFIIVEQALLAHWINQHPPSCGPRFESQTHLRYTFSPNLISPVFVENK